MILLFQEKLKPRSKPLYCPVIFEEKSAHGEQSFQEMTWGKVDTHIQKNRLEVFADAIYREKPKPESF